MQARLAELETVESKLVSSQAEVRHLQHQLRIYRQDAHFVECIQDKLTSYETLQRESQLLREENNSLQQDRANSDLLRYQVQSLQNRCAELEGVMEEVAKLRVENNELKQSIGERKGASSGLQAQLVELQQKEIVSLKNYGDLATQ